MFGIEVVRVGFCNVEGGGKVLFYRILDFVLFTSRACFILGGMNIIIFVRLLFLF